jgi:hypothetical protein
MKGHVRPPDPSQKPAEGKGKERGNLRAALVAGPGQRMEEVEAPDELDKIEDPEEFGKKLKDHLRKKK